MVGQKLIQSEKYLVVDLEATCNKPDGGSLPRREKEIIEIGAVLLDEHGNTLKTFQAFVKPVLHPTLSDFCIKLTGISQEDVDNAETFPVVFPRFLNEMWADDTVFCSWGKYDLNQFRIDFERHHEALKKMGIETFPFPEERFMNLKKIFARIRRLSKPTGVKKAIKLLGLQFQGRLHRGIDDAKNIARIFKITILPRINK